MINLPKVMLILCMTLISPIDTNITLLRSDNNLIKIVDNVIDTDPLHSTSVNDFGLTNKDNIITFIKYIKTQSNHIDSEVGKRDIYYVIQTMFNRMLNDNIDWPTYYNTPSYNCSQSIRLMKSGHLRPSFSINDAHDQMIISMVYSALYGLVEGDLSLDSDVLYFHSFGPKYDKKPHSKDKLVTEARHRFYCK